jgi:hypothetical protein
MAINANQLLEELQTRFFDKLETKTSWGRNELKEMFLNTIIEVTSQYLDVY